MVSEREGSERIDGERESNGDGWRREKKTVSGVVAE